MEESREVMKEVEERVYWRNQDGVSVEGARIEYRAKDHITFYNPLISSGTIIKSWQMSFNYQGSRIQPDLPLLKQGKTYRLQAFLETQPVHTVYMKVQFLNRYGETVDSLIEKSNQVDFVYPKGAYSYSVSLLSAGLISMDFHYLKIEEVEPSEI